MYGTQIIWNFKTTSTAYLVKLEDWRSFQDSQPNYTLPEFIFFFNRSGYVTAANQISTCALPRKCVLKEVVFRVYRFIWWGSVRSAIPENSAKCQVTFRRTMCLSPMNGTGICCINLYAPCILYIGQTYRSSPQYYFYIFSQQIYLITFLYFLSPSSFIPPQNVLYLLMLPFLVNKIFTLYINDMLNCKYPAPGPKG